MSYVLLVDIYNPFPSFYYDFLTVEFFFSTCANLHVQSNLV